MHTDGYTVQSLRGVVRRYKGLVPPVSVVGALDLNNVLVKLDNLMAGIDPDFPEKSKDAAKWDAMSCEELIRSECRWSADARNIMRTAVRVLNCEEPASVSALYFLWYLKTSGGPRRIMETEKGAQDSKVVGGTGRVAPLLAADMEKRHGAAFGSGRLRVMLSHPVRTVTVQDGASSL